MIFKKLEDMCLPIELEIELNKNDKEYEQRIFEDESRTESINVQFDKEIYKAKIESKSLQVNATFKILKMDNNLYCIDLSKKKGDQL